MLLTDETTWPPPIWDFLNNEAINFQGWACECCSNSNVNYDDLVSRFQKILSRFSMIGYHCTKLTRTEIEKIKRHGMQLQDASSLNLRIEELVSTGEIASEIADRLKAENQADDFNRARMLWFLFYTPYFAGESGIGRLFRSWGGEALFNSHEKDPITGPELKRIGIPCVIKVDVPIASLKKTKFPDNVLANVFLANKGHQSRTRKHEGYSIQSIPENSILDIYEYPSEKFMELTKCSTWKRYTI